MKIYSVIFNTSFELGGTPTHISLPPSPLCHAYPPCAFGAHRNLLSRQKAEKCAEDEHLQISAPREEWSTFWYRSREDLIAI
jgi:hypothetical protein